MDVLLRMAKTHYLCSATEEDDIWRDLPTGMQKYELKTIRIMKKIFFSLLMALSVVGCSQPDEKETFKEFAENFSETARFAFAEVGGYNVMLVSHETFGNNVDSNLEAIAADIFALDSKGKIVALGSIRSQGTLYPVSILNGKLMVAGHHFVRTYSIRGEVPELVLDSYGDEDTPELDAMFRTFEKGKPILFDKQAGK